MGIYRLGFIERDGGPFGAANHTACLVNEGHGHRPSRQDEAGEGRERLVHRVNFFLKAHDLALDDPQRTFDRFRRRQVGAKVEQLVLDGAELIGDLPGERAAIAAPMAALASSTSPIAAIRAEDLDTRLPSTSPALPPSPVRV